MVAILRSVVGVVAGIVVGVFIVGGLEIIGHLIFPPPPGMDPMNHESIKEHLHDLPLGAFVSVLVAWSGGILLGSWLGALVAGRGAYLHAGLVGIVFCAFSMLTMALIPHPIWFMFSACAALPLATVSGGFLASLSHRKTPT